MSQLLMSTPTTPADSSGRLGRVSTTPGSPESWSDDELLLLIRSGDPAAFGELYRRYEHEARRFARSLVARDDVDDVVAESFTKMLRAMNGGKGPVDHPARYLMVTVRTTAASLHGRRAKSESVVKRLRVEEAATDNQLTVTDPDLIKAFQSLMPRWRQVIWWSEIEGRSPAEIAERLDLSPAAVAALSYRARRALREAYAEQVAASDADL